MSFFKPFLQFANTESNIGSVEATFQLEDDTRDLAHSPAQSHLQCAVPTAVGTSVEEPKPTEREKVVKKKCSDDKSNISSVDKVLSYLQAKQSNLKNATDDLQLLFMGYAVTVRKLSPRQQTLVKHKIAMILMEAELSEQGANGNTALLSRLESLLSASNRSSSCPSSNITTYSTSPPLSFDVPQNNTGTSRTQWYEDFAENISH
ncbi:denn domain-containing [Holotrichia oblita]|uniref:Denn domain-containing n=1 Tax=Holotrichia oblita TaxID=644536 RepID=A0ACB9TV50_HOLOL|nr:denn domain-containing [Holotrichia oblita]